MLTIPELRDFLVIPTWISLNIAIQQPESVQGIAGELIFGIVSRFLRTPQSS